MRRSVLVPLVALAVVAAVGGCRRGNESDVQQRVAGWLADLEGDEAAAQRAAAGLAALGPSDAAAVPALMNGLHCAPEAVTDHHDHDHHEHGTHDHAAAGGHAHEGCNDHIVIAAAGALGAIGIPAVQPLLAVVREGDETNRTFAAYALARMNPAAAPALIAALDDPAPHVRAAVIGALRTMMPLPTEALPAIATRLAADADVEVRAQAADALGHFGAAAVPRLVPALEDAAAPVRASAASALRSIGVPARAAASALIAHLTDSAPTVRLNVAAALPAIGADDAATVAALATALTDPDHTVRWGAAMALGRFGAKAAGAKRALEAARDDPQAIVRSAAKDALAQLAAAGR